MILDYRNIDLFGKLLFEKVLLKPPFKKQNAMSNEACFLYIINGEYNSISESEQLRIKNEEAVLMKCGNYLSQMYKSSSSEKYEAVAVHFFPEVLRKVYDNKLPNFLKQKDTGLDKSTMAKVNSDIIINKYIDSVLFYFDNPNLVNEDILILKLKEIILLLNQTQNAPKIRTILSNLFNPQTYSFRDVIEAHFYSTISLSELAQLTNMSLSSFKREFQRIYHTPPATFLLQKKLEKASELLKVSSNRMSDIAFDCGFNNLSHFSKAFKKHHKISPSIYRLNQ
ncbi:helix-turn-helix domain-containing protein [Flagellimonas sp.]|uniref:helix-turn-helix domain-containing protein n=1 Tax=Flagellimonas sp. TaxID=2058762 RepID=UPI003B50A5CE